MSTYQVALESKLISVEDLCCETVNHKAVQVALEALYDLAIGELFANRDGCGASALRAMQAAKTLEIAWGNPVHSQAVLNLLAVEYGAI